MFIFFSGDHNRQNTLLTSLLSLLLGIVFHSIPEHERQAVLLGTRSQCTPVCRWPADTLCTQ